VGVDIYAEFANVIAGLTPRWLDDDVEKSGGLGYMEVSYRKCPKDR
jgi:hypothetical protein